MGYASLSRRTTFLALACVVACLSRTDAAEPALPSLRITEHIPYPAPPQHPSQNTVVELTGDTPAKREFIAKQWKLVEEIAPEHRSLLGPDASFVRIDLEVEGRKLSLASWHPLFEKNPKLVVTSTSVMALEGRDREEVLKKEPAWFLEFRRVFDAVVKDAKAFGK